MASTIFELLNELQSKTPGPACNLKITTKSGQQLVGDLRHWDNTNHKSLVCFTEFNGIKHYLHHESIESVAIIVVM